MPTTILPPNSYDPKYCEGVHVVCSQKMDAIGSEVTDIHGAVFGSKEQPGLIMMLTKKLSIATLKWFLVVFAVPAIMAGFAFYEFYISAPLTYADKATVGAIENRVLKVEEGIKHLPTAMQMKDIVKEAIKESKVP